MAGSPQDPGVNSSDASGTSPPGVTPPNTSPGISQCPRGGKLARDWEALSGESPGKLPGRDHSKKQRGTEGGSRRVQVTQRGREGAA